MLNKVAMMYSVSPVFIKVTPSIPKNIMFTNSLVVLPFQPQENYNEWRLIYFISFLLLVGFFVLNMFVGVVVENFHRCRAEQEKEERARRAAKRAKKIEERRRSKDI